MPGHEPPLRGSPSSSPSSRPRLTAAATTFRPKRPQVPLAAFCTFMEEAIAARPRPRAYLAPSPPQKYAPADTFAPAIDPRSKQLAAKIRPKVRARERALLHCVCARGCRGEAINAGKLT